MHQNYVSVYNWNAELLCCILCSEQCSSHEQEIYRYIPASDSTSATLGKTQTLHRLLQKLIQLYSHSTVPVIDYNLQYKMLSTISELCHTSRHTCTNFLKKIAAESVSEQVRKTCKILDTHWVSSSLHTATAVLVCYSSLTGHFRLSSEDFIRDSCERDISEAC